MEHPARDRKSSGGHRFQVTVSGNISAEEGRWFGSERVTAAGPNTVLEFTVADQSELFGRLRRIHDMHLQLISFQRLEDTDRRDRGTG